MKYKVEIYDTETGKAVIYDTDLDWNDSSLFFWTDGNFGCGCNRGMSFDRALGVSEDKIEQTEYPCNDRYKVTYAILEDGTRIKIDAEMGKS